MSLPTLQLPTYELTLPASKKKVKYRPFVVKEQKILLLAMEEKKSESIMNAIGQIIDLCTFNVCKISEMIQVDIEYLFVHIRNKSLGEGVDLVVTCPSCQTKNDVVANLETIQVIEPTEKVSNEIKLADNCWAIMNYPTLLNTLSVSDSAVEKDTVEIIAECMQTLIVGESSYDMKDFSAKEKIDWTNNLTEIQKEMIVKFFRSVPTIIYEEEFQCGKCGEKSKIRLEGLDSFFG